MLRNKIFVTSRPKGNTVEFVKDIFKTSNQDFPQALVDKRLKETEGDYVGVCIPYEMDTKYYTARVDFWIDEIDAASEKETIKAYCEKEGDISRVIDAFVFLFDKDKPESFDTLSLWKPFLEQANPSICLCIGTSSNTPLSMERDAEIGDWCISNGFDYVDMDEATDTPLDKVGIELSLDILQTNLWDGMQKKNRANKADHEEEEALLRDIQALKLQHDKDVLTLNDESDSDGYEDMPSQDEISQMRTELFGDIDGEDGIDKAFEAIQAMREHGKNMSDEERRKMAAKVALSFAAQLGL